MTFWQATFNTPAQTLPVTNGLKLWLRAEAGLTTHHSGAVTTWADQSGWGNHAAAPADLAKAPTVECNALNGKPTVRFGGGIRYLDVPNSASLSGLTQDVTILTLVKYDDVNSNGRGSVAKTLGNLPAPFDWYNAESIGGRTVFYLGNGSQEYFHFVSTATPPVGAYNVMGFSWRNGIADQYLDDFNNGHAAYTTMPGDGGGPLRIGSRADLGTQLKGNLAELLIYQPALSDADRTAVIEYLRTKYALVFNQPPTASILNPASGWTVDAQADLPVRIKAADPDGTVARVDLLQNGATVASWTQPPYAVPLSSLNPGTAVLTAVAVDNHGRTAASAPVSLSVTGAVLYRFDAAAVSGRATPAAMKLGTNRNPKGDELGINSFHWTRNGKPWLPVMGELHYARYPREQWEEAILKMKAGGIDIVATYVFGILHQEIEGQWDWTGNKDLRHFMQLCAQHGLYVWLRAGPYCHGECRNGGYPDWLLPRLGGPKTADPALKKYARQVYRQVNKQSEGLLFKDGGPVIGLQLDNECGDGAFLVWLKQLARAEGIDVPYYSQTGWAGAQVPPNEMIPVYGGYPDAPWTGGTHHLIPANQYTFTGTTANAAYAYEFEKCRQMLDQGFWLPAGVPYATVEMGTGNQIRYPRRPLFTKGDIDAMQYIVIGKGANMLGYYMYHGGSHPVGKLTTMEDTYDYPKISYDFLAALGEYGKPQPWYHSLRVLHLFLQDFGETLAPMFPVLPSRWPASPADSDTLRCSVRVNGDSGFLFFNNYHRGLPMKNLGPLQFQVKLRNEILAVPQAPVTIPSESYAIWPMNQPLEDALLKYATAQPLCRLNVDGGSHYFFKTTDGVAPEYVFDNQTITSVDCPGAKITRSGKWATVGHVPSGTESLISLQTQSGRKIAITTFTTDEAEQCYKATIWGRARVFLSPDCLIVNGERLEVLHAGKANADTSTPPDGGASAHPMGLPTASRKPEETSIAVFPPVEAGLLAGQKPLRGVPDGIFGRCLVAVPRQDTPVTWEALSEAELRGTQNALAGAQWIWSDASNTNPATAYFRKEFTLPAGAKVNRATLRYSAANHSKLWIGGQLVDEGGSAAMVPPVLDVTDRLQAGRNVIAVSAVNPAGPGGWIAKLGLEFQDGRSQTVVTDPTWKTATAEQPDWFAVDFGDGAWSAAVKMADWGGKPWSNVPATWYGPARKAYRIQLPQPVTEGLSDVLLRINYVGDVACLTEGRSGRLLADNFYSQPLWDLGLRHFSPESLRGGVVLWITALKRDAQIYMPEESRPKFNGPELAELRSIVAIPEYKMVLTSPAPNQ
jgi:hypothetical protein